VDSSTLMATKTASACTNLCLTDDAVVPSFSKELQLAHSLALTT